MKVEYILFILFIFDFIKTLVFEENKAIGYVKFILFNISFVHFFINNSIQYEVTSVLLALIFFERKFSLMHFLLCIFITILFQFDSMINLQFNSYYLIILFLGLCYQNRNGYYLGIIDLVFLYCIPGLNFSPIALFCFLYFLKGFNYENHCNNYNMTALKFFILIFLSLFKIDLFSSTIFLYLLFITFGLLIINATLSYKRFKFVKN